MSAGREFHVRGAATENVTKKKYMLGCDYTPVA